MATKVAVTADAERVQVGDDGAAYYVTLDQWSALHRVDLRAPGHPDTLIFGTPIAYQPDIQLSRDGHLLYVGESQGSGCQLLTYDPSSHAIVQRSTWNNHSGFSGPARWVYLGRRETHVYFADHQLDATNLGFMAGATGQVFAEDDAGTFAVSHAGIVDAVLLQLVAPFSAKASAAALSADDKEVWWYDPGAGFLHDEQIADLLGGRTLGVREQPARSLSSYRFSHLIADPVRDRLYGLDPDAQAVVSIDRTTLQPDRVVVVGSAASDIDIDPYGTLLYVGHEATQAIAEIDLDAFAFDRFLLTAGDTYDVAAVGAHRVASISLDQFVNSTLMDVDTGAVLDTGAGGFAPAIAASADGKTLFVGESAINGGVITRYDVSTDRFVATVMSGETFDNVARALVVAPDGSRLFYGGSVLDGATLKTLVPFAASILSVTPDGRLAMSANRVFRVSDGAMVGSLSPPSTAQAVSSDSRTLFVATSGGISRVDLSGF